MRPLVTFAALRARSGSAAWLSAWLAPVRVVQPGLREILKRDYPNEVMFALGPGVTVLSRENADEQRYDQRMVEAST